MYEHVFELLLRLKGNYLWPAMWRPKAFNDDDPQNMVLADAMGVVMGTSHHEPMMRAHDEWHRHTEQGVTGGDWDYSTNAANLRKFWQGGVERMMSEGRRPGIREPGHDRHARRRRRGDDGQHRDPVCSRPSSPTSVASSRSHRQAGRADAAGLGALQGSAGLLRSAA